MLWVHALIKVSGGVGLCGYLVPEMTHYVSIGTLNSTHSFRTLDKEHLLDFGTGSRINFSTSPSLRDIIYELKELG